MDTVEKMLELAQKSFNSHRYGYARNQPKDNSSNDAHVRSDKLILTVKKGSEDDDTLKNFAGAGVTINPSLSEHGMVNGSPDFLNIVFVDLAAEGVKEKIFPYLFKRQIASQARLSGGEMQRDVANAVRTFENATGMSFTATVEELNLNATADQRKISIG